MASANNANSGKNGNTWPTKQTAVIPVRGGDHAIGISKRQRDRFFHEHVFACVERRDRHRGMLSGWRADVDQVDLGIRQHRGE